MGNPSFEPFSERQKTSYGEASDFVRVSAKADCFYFVSSCSHQLLRDGFRADRDQKNTPTASRTCWDTKSTDIGVPNPIASTDSSTLNCTSCENA